MPGKIFINYRRDDAPGDARGIREGLVAAFGKSSVFMDVDNLLAGQRFDKELEKALAQCDLLIAVMGPRWMEILSQRDMSQERDYVREEIAAALKRGIVVIPVRVGREGNMVPLPRKNQLPDDIQELVLHHKQDIAHERFGRDIAELVGAIVAVRGGSTRRLPTAAIIGGLAVLAAASVASLSYVSFPTLWAPADSRTEGSGSSADEKQPQEKAAASPARAGVTIRDCLDVCPELVVVPAGEFSMGSPDSEPERGSNEGPAHIVRLAKSLAVAMFETTFAEWDACVADGGCTHMPDDNGWGRGRRPVVNVSWDDAQQYVGWLRKKTNKPYRLLSEAEWEYSARAGTTTPFFFGQTISDVEANYNATVAYADGAKGKFRGQTIEVGSLGKPNAFGLHDMHGNVWEYVQDCAEDTYDGAPTDGSPHTSGSCQGRAVRGGSWYNDPGFLRSAVRFEYSTSSRADDSGLRVARSQ